MKTTVATELARAVARARERALHAQLRENMEMLLVDIGGLCVDDPNTEYAQAP
jgi:hypothetical protein